MRSSSVMGSFQVLRRWKREIVKQGNSLFHQQERMPFITGYRICPSARNSPSGKGVCRRGRWLRPAPFHRPGREVGASPDSKVFRGVPGPCLASRRSPPSISARSGRRDRPRRGCRLRRWPACRSRPFGAGASALALRTPLLHWMMISSALSSSLMREVQLAQRNELRTRNVGDVVFEGFAHIEEDELVAPILPGLELFHRNLGHGRLRVLLGLGLRNTAELRRSRSTR